MLGLWLAAAAGGGSGRQLGRAAAAGTSAPARARRRTQPATRSATLVLDFTPNAVHAGIYTALARDYDRGAGRRPARGRAAASTDSIKLLETGRVDFAILDIHDLAIARERGEDIVGIMAIVQRPLAAVIAAPQIRTPRELEGQTVGVTGVPSDTAVLHSIVAGAGGDPAKVKTITIGFNAVADLLAGRVAGATAFWNDEGVTLAARRARVSTSSGSTTTARPPTPSSCCARRARRCARDPASPGRRQGARPGLRLHARRPRAGRPGPRVAGARPRPALVAAQLTALLPAFRPPDGSVGELEPRRARLGRLGGAVRHRRRPPTSARCSTRRSSPPQQLALAPVQVRRPARAADGHDAGDSTG